MGHRDRHAREDTAMSIRRAPFGFATGGAPVERFTFDDEAGTTVDVITFGGHIARIRCPDRMGRAGDVVLGFEALESYVRDTNYVGPICGRYCNRIGGASV